MGDTMNYDKHHIIKDFVVTHTIPDLTEEEKEAVKKDILLKIYNLFTNEDLRSDIKLKQHK
jgi:hypothetical protein